VGEEDERERLSVVEPPGATVAEERAKLWACKRLLNGNKSPARSVKLLKKFDIFIRSRASKRANRQCTG
jgi:hypothetical protein